MSDEAQARVEIADLIARYGLHFDAKDGDAFAALFTADGSLIRPDGSALSGRLELKSAAEDAPPMQHFPGPPAIDFEGDLARARSRVIALRVDGSALRIVTAGEYQDELINVDGGWLIQVRRILAWLPAELSNAALALAQAAE